MSYKRIIFAVSKEDNNLRRQNGKERGRIVTGRGAREVFDIVGKHTLLTKVNHATKFDCIV